MFTLLVKFYFTNCSFVFQKKKEKYLEINSWGPATRFYCVHYFCFHSKSSHLLSSLCWGVIWFWMPSAAIVCWCACDLTLFAECAVDAVQKEKLITSHSQGFFAEGLTLRSNLCALCVLRKDVAQSGATLKSLPLAPMFLRFFLTLRSHWVIRAPRTFPVLLF